MTVHLRSMYIFHRFLIDSLLFFLIPVKVTQAEVDPLVNKPICTTEEIHPQFTLFTCAPRTIIPDATIPVGVIVARLNFLFIKTINCKLVNLLISYNVFPL